MAFGKVKVDQIESTAQVLTLPTTTGASNNVLSTDGTGTLAWVASNPGDAVGPATSTDNAVTRYDSTTGKLLQDSAVTIGDTGEITAPSVGSVIPFYYADQSAFPSASTYHGAIAHSHADGAMYYAHGGAWLPLSALGTAQTFTAGQRGEITTLTDAATVLVDFANSNHFSITLGGNRTLDNPTNQVAGQSGSLFVVQDATGSRTLAYSSDWEFAGGSAPTLSTAASAVDRIDYIVRASGNIHAVFTAAYS